MNFLKLIRYQNLLMLALMQLVFRYGFLNKQNVLLALYDWQYVLLILATVCIAAGGYIINDIYDQETDGDNRPGKVIVGKAITETRAYNYYVALNIIGVAIGFYLSNYIGRPSFSLLFILISATLYMYATTFKQSLLVGNVLVAVLLSVSILIIGIYDVYPMLPFAANPYDSKNAFLAISYYAIFALVINLIREIIKDLEDVNGDYNQGMHTLPIVLGVARTTKIMFWIGLLPTGYLMYYVYTHFFNANLLYSTIYFLGCVIAPLIYFNAKMWNAQTQKDYRHLAAVLKLVLLTGIISIAVITFEAGANA